MRKSLWIVPVLLLIAFLGAPSAHADSYTPNFTCTGTCAVAPPTAPDVSFPSPAIMETWFVVGVYIPPIALALPATDSPTDTYTWSNTNDILATPPFVSLTITDITTGAVTSVTETYNVSFARFTDSGNLTFTAVPEPGTVSLILIGIGLVFVMRKRIAWGLRQAT